jgi:ParB family chromosome partitioning protein
MSKSYLKNVEESSLFLRPVHMDGEKGGKGERFNTSPLREAKFIDIERINPDPNQPRKTFVKETLESLAESIKEVGGIIDPLTVEYDEKEDSFKIISGERRYKAAKMVGMERLPCIIKEVDNKKRLLLQLILNLQREDITPLEESAGIKALMERLGYSQVNIAKLLNKSQSYISQILGLDRLTQPAREILQTSEVPKEVQIQASKEKDPARQSEILKKASEEGKTVMQIRANGVADSLHKAEKSGEALDSVEISDEMVRNGQKFSKWTWSPKDGRFVVTIQFSKEQAQNKKIQAVKAALEEAFKYVRDLIHRNY